MSGRDARCDRVEPEQREVGEVVLRQFFAGKMRMHAPQTSKSISADACAAKIRHLDLLCGADHYVFDLAFAIQQHADLATGFVA